MVVGAPDPHSGGMGIESEAVGGSLLPVGANTVLAVSVVSMIIVEAIVHTVRGRRIPVGDSGRSAVIGLGYLAIRVVAARSVAFAFYIWLYTHARLFDLSWRSPAVWVGFWIVGDFTYYWIHRAEHVVRVLWCSHLVHHSSEDFSFTTAVRMPWTDVFYKPVTGLWAPLIGFPPVMYPVMGALSLMIGQLQHTRLIGRLGPLDKVLMTPSNHRVHHASNPVYIDKNFGGHTAIWDQLFGTYQAEAEEPRYGLTHPLSSTSTLAIVAGGYPELFHDMLSAPSTRARLALCVGRPS
jgi:sterol desaturase/sphingolipid hydroxylase (fatty acid hydroxylase superfamily)